MVWLSYKQVAHNGQYSLILNSHREVASYYPLCGPQIAMTTIFIPQLSQLSQVFFTCDDYQASIFYLRNQTDNIVLPQHPYLISRRYKQHLEELYYFATTTNNMNRIDRLFGILILLQSKKFVAAEQIAEKYEISVRTVYRDIKALCEQGVPVSFEPNRGYFIVKEYFLPPVSFTTEEVNAFLLMETLVEGFADRGVGTHYTQAMNKVRAVLRPAQKETLENLKQNIKLQLPSCFINHNQHLTLLQEAISKTIIIQIDYCNAKEEYSTRKVEPIGLIFYALNWHLIAWCHTRGGYRDFKVSRIAAAINTHQPFQKTDHISVGDYMNLLPVTY